MAFPTSNLSLSAVLTAYGITTGKMSDLRGKYYYSASPLSTLQTIPPSGNFSLQILLGQTPWTASTAPVSLPVTSAGVVNIPASYPLPTGFSMTLIGGGGGGGGGGGAFIATNGGDGGGGGAGGTLVTNFLPYNSTAITVTLPTAGGQGSGGSGSGTIGDPGNNGANGGVGGAAILVYNSNTYQGSGGGFGWGGGGGNGASSGGDGTPGLGGSFTGPSPSTGTTGSNAGSPNIYDGGLIPSDGRGGNGGQKGFFNGGNGGVGGVSASPGSINITWYYI